MNQSTEALSRIETKIVKLESTRTNGELPAVIPNERKKPRPKIRPKLEKDCFQGRVRMAAERRAAGKALRDLVPRESHAEWKGSAERPDPIDVLISSNRGRMPELVPIRHGRMLTSPFAFLRGSAAGMASDLSRTPTTGIRVQACGDCHLMNFGAFATPERQFNFDINDFDETLPAPWEWDVKRLTASIVIAGRYLKFKERDSLAAAERAVRTYRRQMGRYAEMRAFEVWYDHVSAEQVMSEMSPDRQKFIRARIEKVRAQGVVEHDFPKLTQGGKGKPRIKDNPPLMFHLQGNRSKELSDAVFQGLRMYRSTLAPPYRVLLDRFRFYDLAVKVVGVGSVGTLCMVVLLMAADNDPLFLQVKQANASVLERYAGKSVYSNHGERVVMGQRLMQAASDMMLGWTVGKPAGRHFYLRQLRDMKLSAMLETFDHETLSAYGKICGWALARAHARSGDAAMISGYLGKSDVFDQAIVKFASKYADQTESDHRTMRKAVSDRRLEVAVIEG
jgi:uncharacterized protein (DUF2252 family)